MINANIYINNNLELYEETICCSLLVSVKRAFNIRFSLVLTHDSEFELVFFFLSFSKLLKIFQEAVFLDLICYGLRKMLFWNYVCLVTYTTTSLLYKMKNNLYERNYSISFILKTLMLFYIKEWTNTCSSCFLLEYRGQIVNCKIGFDSLYVYKLFFLCSFQA